MTAEPATRTLSAEARSQTSAIAEVLDLAARSLASGGLVAFPTETVYGLGADATNGEAVARLYAAKGRPQFNPLIAHVGNPSTARRLAAFDDVAEQLATAFWPGPLTLVLPKTAACDVSDLALAGLDTIALRMPAHSIARELLKVFGKPIVAPSANRSGHVSPTTAAHVLSDLRGRIDLIVDGGPCEVGVESTIVSLVDEPTLLRPGGLPRAYIERILGRALADAPISETPTAPGMLASHYAPKAQVRLDATEARPDEALLAFGHVSNAPANTLNLSPRGDLVEAAANLFSHLRALDRSGAKMIAVMPVPNDGLGEAINDRLRRAAAPRK
jgi:L-threonylcarbamoyladenylate synthase